MNKIVKRKLIGAIICIVLGIAFLVYQIINPQSISEDLHAYMNGFAGGIIGVGIYTIIIAIKAMKSPKKAKELENEIKDERLNSINDRAMALVLKICIILEATISVICAFMEIMELAKYLGFVICFQVILYLIIYCIIKRNS